MKSKEKHIQIKYVYIPDRPEVYAVYYSKQNTMCLNHCFSGRTKLIIKK